MTFGITPATGFNPPAADDFPQFIQFQDEGTALGGPDADTVNFTGAGVTATRGTGEAANVVTVDIPGGGGGGGAAPTLFVLLTANDPQAMNGAVFSDWTGAPQTTSTDAAWDSANQGISILHDGFYRIQISAVAPRTDNGQWPRGETYVGSSITEDFKVPRTVYARNDTDTFTGENVPGWSDDFVVSASAGQLIQPKVYARSYLYAGTNISFQAHVTVQKIG